MKTPREWAIEAFDGLKFLPSIEVVVAMLEEKFSAAQADARREAIEEAAQALEVKVPMEEHGSTLIYGAALVRALQT